MVITQALLISVICMFVISPLSLSHRLNLSVYFILSISIIFFLSENLDHLYLVILFLTLLGGILMLLMFLSSYTSDTKMARVPSYVSVMLSMVFFFLVIPSMSGVESASTVEFSSDPEVLGVEVILILVFLTLLMLVVFIWLA